MRGCVRTHIYMYADYCRRKVNMYMYVHISTRMQIFADAGLRCVRVGMDENGMRVDDLEGWLKTAREAPAFVYCIPRL